MLIQQSGLSQTVYPKLSIIEKDTVGIFLINQVREINLTYLKLDEAQENLFNLRQTITKYRSLAALQSAKNDVLESKIKIHNGILIQKDYLLVQSELELRIAEKEKRKYRRQRNIVITGTLIICGYTAFH